jgi:hypothetical protein
MQNFNKENLLKFGLPGLLALMLMYAGPYVVQGWQMHKAESRIDKELSETAWGRYAHRLELQIEKVNKSLLETNSELAAVKAELRLIRSADYYAPVAMWELDKGLRFKWFNDAFVELMYEPQGIDPKKAYGKTWEELFSKEQATLYSVSDREVLKTREGVTFRTWSMSLDGSKTYWVLIKYPIIDGNNKLEGIKGIAVIANSLTD